MQNKPWRKKKKILSPCKLLTLEITEMHLRINFTVLESDGLPFWVELGNSAWLCCGGRSSPADEVGLTNRILMPGGEGRAGPTLRVEGAPRVCGRERGTRRNE